MKCVVHVTDWDILTTIPGLSRDAGCLRLWPNAKYMCSTYSGNSDLADPRPYRQYFTHGRSEQWLRIQVASENGFYFQLLDWCNGGSARCLGRAVPFHVTETVSTSASVSGFGCQWFMRSYVTVHPDICNSISRICVCSRSRMYRCTKAHPMAQSTAYP